MAHESDTDRLKLRATEHLSTEIEHRTRVRIIFDYVTRHPITGEDVPLRMGTRQAPQVPESIEHLLRELSQIVHPSEEAETATGSKRDAARLEEHVAATLPKEIEHHVKVRIIFEYVTRHPLTGEDVPVEVEARHIST